MTLPCGAQLRSLSSDRDYDQCLELQRLTWGDDFRELVPPTVVKISQKVGGIAAGAFDDDVMVGFVWGLSGVRDGRSAHWSHMLAVVPSEQGRGLGGALKRFQRDCLLRLGVGEMYWTFDPLVARNANLNLRSLGARPVEYVENMYGADTGSEMHSGLGTDRFIVRWELRPEQTQPDREPSVPVLPIPSSAEPTAWGFRSETTDWIEIPADIETVKLRSSAEAAGWRERTRRQLLSRLQRGARCVGLLVQPAEAVDAEQRFFYVFDGASGAEETLR